MSVPQQDRVPIILLKEGATLLKQKEKTQEKIASQLQN
jgi:hypothetical protein